MALGLLTPVKGANYSTANKRVRVFDVQFTTGANYQTGGETIRAGDVGLRSRIDQVSVLSAPRGAAGGLRAGIDYGSAGASPTSVKVLAFFSSAVASTPDPQAAAASDLSGFTMRLLFVGA